MTEYRLVAEPRADLDIAAAYQWYEAEGSGLGLEFLQELSSAYETSSLGSGAFSSVAFPMRCTSLSNPTSS